ncbi:MAG: Asp-tRNA(Asn)/Glu-tRNA(Gln) amidotransferase subunit GatB [Acidimicrobiia bacterium]|nr:Asp-tRNA(Asn)/Glu-tRNA(Gln) amidotransferase subunit GatB [Acidimicrobiia bacterium]
MTTTEPGTSESTSNPPGDWEVVIGLEVHAELATRTKLFSSARNEFGGEPNTHVDPTSLGLPGSLPVLNEKAVELAIRVGLALGCEIRPSVFARKNYFYPDMPKDFQISQYDQPINVGGSMELPTGQVVGIERAHLEEDTGKSTHVGTSGRISGADFSLVDYNRAGVPLLEIVGRPDLRSAEEAATYVEELRQILVAIGASDGKLEEGSMRVDANVSLHHPGEALGTRCEIKNVNSLRSLRRAIDYEAARQVEVLEAGGKVRQETRHWDEAVGRTLSGRSKEEAEDYRYFPEPDLVPIAPDAQWVERVRASMPLLPAQRRARLAVAGGVRATEGAVVIAVQRGLDDLAVAAIDVGADPSRVLTHVEHNLAVEGADRLGAASLAELVGMEVSGELTATQTKTVLAELLASDGAASPRDIAKAKGFEAMDSSALESMIDEVVAAHPAEWERYVADPSQRGKLSGFFIGKVMKATRGQADGKVVTGSLLRRAG